MPPGKILGEKKENHALFVGGWQVSQSQWGKKRGGERFGYFVLERENWVRYVMAIAKTFGEIKSK